MIIGHQPQLQFLKNFLEKGLSFSGFLFSGPEKVGKKLIAQEFLKGLICQNNLFGGCQKEKTDTLCSACRGNFSRDYLLINEEFNPQTVFPELNSTTSSYGIETSRAIIKFLSTAPTWGRKKAVLIDNAHLLTPQAQNSLLKIIEEPPATAVLIMVSHLPSEILATIRSRLMEIKFGLVKKQELVDWLNQISLEEELKREIEKYALLRPGRAQEFLSQPERLKEFKETVLKLLRLEQRSPAEKIILLEKFLTQADPSLFELWQIILRDELYQSLGLEEQRLLLTKKRPVNLPRLILTLKKTQTLLPLVRRFEGLKENALKQLALMV